MKKKVIFAVATGLFALATVFNMNVLQTNNAGDVSLESIAVMAQAQWEGGLNEFDCECSPCTNEADQQGVVFRKFYSPGGNCSGSTMCSYGFC